MRRWGYYELPGPSAFLDCIEQDIQEEGRSVILDMGCFAPHGWSEALNERLGDDWYWKEINLSGSSPVEALTQGMQKPKERGVAGVDDIYAFKGFGRQIFIVKSPDDTTTKVWLNFLLEFADITRRQPLPSRSVILLLVPPDFRGRMPENVMIRQYSFEGVVSPVDMLINANQQISDTQKSVVLRNLRIQLCMELSLWDFELCNELSSCSLSELIEPIDRLKRYAEKVGFQELVSEGDNDRLIKAGARGQFEGEERFHSAILALIDGDPRTINRRVWRAQLRVLYPFVEECRQNILDQYASFIKLPHTRKYGEKVESLQEMEIGDIKVNLDQNLQQHRRLKNFIRNLWKIRKALAHQDVVPPRNLAERDMDWDYADNHN